MEPVDWSLNWTDNGEFPVVGVPVKFATGATGGVLDSDIIRPEFGIRSTGSGYRQVHAVGSC